MVKVPENDASLQADFVTKIDGDSMEPEFFDGEYVLVKSLPTIDIGDIFVFNLNNSQ